MSLSNSIALSFTVDNGCFRLVSSSENTAGLDEKISAKSGISFKQVADAFKTYNLSQCDFISVKLTPKDNAYFMTFDNIPGLAQDSIKLNEAFVKTISGCSPTPPAIAVPSPSKKGSVDGQVMIPASKADKKDLAPATLGILNNTTHVDCFMNAVMQVIMHNQLLRGILIDTYQHDDSPRAQALMAAINLYAAGETITTTALRAFMPRKVQQGQQDAHEFLSALLNAVNIRNHPELYAKVKTTYTWERKEGFIFSKVVESVNTSHEAPELVIPLHLPKTAITGDALIQDLFAKRSHAGENYRQEQTGKLFSPGQVQVSLENQPPQLVFLLNRFTFAGKVLSPISMPDTVIINGGKYTLKQIVMHHGRTMQSGHYTALLRDEQGGWTHANDTTITLNTKRSDLTDGYIYFYERV